MHKKNIAEIFGKSLDQDDYQLTRSVLDPDCIYIIGEQRISGPVEISASYENNMIAGRKKLDKLVWGKSWIDEISEDSFYVHFTDYITHKGKEYIHRCKQKLHVNNLNKIHRIEHVHDEDEHQRLQAYYQSVGLGK